MSSSDHCSPGAAVIVGVGSGLGRALAKRFAEAGHAVALAARDTGKLADLVGEIEAAGGTIRAYQADATEDAAVEALFARAEAELGPAEVVVYNAGERGINGILEMDSAEFERVWRVSCLGGMIVGREAARGMVARGRGTILFTGGRSSRRALAGWAAFAAGKFGLRAVAQAMAHELSPKGVHIAYMIIEGGIDNERTRQLGNDKAGPDGLSATVALAEIYYQTHLQHRSCWSFEVDLRPWSQPFTT